MKTLIVLLRGINVGGHKRLKMAQLKSICDSVGLANVETYLQSGNVVCDTSDAPAHVATRVEEALRDSAALDVRVIVRTPADLSRAIEQNPFGDAARTDPNRVLVTFLERRPAAQAAAAFLERHSGPELVDLRGSELYIRYPNGAGTSKLTHNVIERALGVTGTARNWNTVSALFDLAARR